MKSISEVKTQGKRHKVSFKLPSVEEMADSVHSDPLPIVELKPFVSKVWRREKSFVQTLDKCPSVRDKSAKSDSEETEGLTSRRYKYKDNEAMPEIAGEDSSLAPPPKSAQSLPSSTTVKRLLGVYVNAFEDFKSQKEHIQRLVGESDFKRKTRLHPAIDSKSKRQLEHSVSIIPGFITRDDRAKTTLNEISEGDLQCKAYSCRPNTVKPDEFEKQQEIRISGEPLIQNDKLPYDCTPTPVRGFHTSWHMPGIRHGSPASMLTTARVMRERRLKRAKTPLYDHLDRSGTLPSLMINSKNLRRRDSYSDDIDSDDYMDYQEMYPPSVMHKVGGIENALLVLSKEGSPTKLERQLTFELKQNLSRFRKSKDYSPFEINPSEIAKYCPTPVLKMTHGEAHIRQALQSNSSKRKLIRKENDQKNVRPAMYALGYQQSTAMGKRSYMESEHIDSFENICSDDMPDLQRTLAASKEVEDFDSMLPDEELLVPYDTPRSRVDSRFSTKHSEERFRVQSEPVHGSSLRENNGSTHASTVENKKKSASANKTVGSVSFSNTSTKSQNNDRPRNKSQPSTKAPTEKARCKSLKETPVLNNIHGSKVGLQTNKFLPTLQTSHTTDMDGTGKTFLTSDNIVQVAAVKG